MGRMSAPSHIVIIGCGFGGLEAARKLRHAPVRITLVDRSNHHLFQPLLYQVATAGLSAPSIAAPIRQMMRGQRNVTTLMAEVENIDKDARVVSLSDGQTLRYDYLIVAAGATHSYFGNDRWAEHAPGLKTLEDAFRLRARMLLAFEHAEMASTEAEREAWLHFVIIGAGPTGVEMAGTLAEIARHTLKHEFRRIDPARAQVMLIEGSPRVLQALPEALSAKAARQLEGLGVQVRTDTRVVEIDGLGVDVLAGGQPERIQARTVIWAAGVAASPLGRCLQVPLDRAGRVVVEPDLSVPGHPELFVVGDMAAALSHEADGATRPTPGVSPAAKQMGRRAAANILARLSGAATQPFRYADYGSLATIGRKAAVADLGRVQFSGFAAWLFWLFVHIYFLIGFRSRIVVMLDWAWAYFSFERSARVIAEQEHSSGAVPNADARRSAS
jgi:NADH dehydrogenase